MTGRGTVLVEFGRRVRELRTERDRDLAEVASAAGVTPAWLEAVERGAVEADIGTVFVLAEVLAVMPGEFFADL